MGNNGHALGEDDEAQECGGVVVECTVQLVGKQPLKECTYVLNVLVPGAGLCHPGRQMPNSPTCLERHCL